MSEPIKAGDLVVAVRGHECDIGKPFVVKFIEPTLAGFWECDLCGGHWYSDEDVSAGEREGYGVPLRFLKRIPPLDELEREQERKELHV